MSNNSTDFIFATTPHAKGNITSAELWIHLTVFYAFLCGGVSTVGNTLILIGILRTKKLRNRFFVIVASLTLCRILLCLQFLTMAIYRILRQIGVAPANMTRLACHSIHFWLLIGLTLEMMFLLALVVDRAMALVAASLYRRLTTSQAAAMCAAIYLFGILIKLPPSYAQIQLSQVVACTNSYSAPGDIFNSYTQNIDLSLLILILLVYVVLIVYVQLRVKRLKESDASNRNQAASVALKRQLRLMPMLRNLVLAHCALALISKVLRTMAGVYDSQSEASARFTAYGGVFSTMDLFWNMLALIWSNKDIRMAAVPCLDRGGAGSRTDGGATAFENVTQMPTTNRAATSRINNLGNRIVPAQSWMTNVG